MNELSNLKYCTETVSLKYTIESSFLSLGERLMKIRDEKLFQPQWETFGTYVAELKMSESSASKLINIYKRFILEYNIEPQKLLKAGGWSVIAEVLPVVHNKRDAISWINKMGELTKEDIRKEILEQKTGITQMNCPHTDTYTIQVCRTCGDRIKTNENN